MKKAFTKKDIKAITKNMSEEEAMDVIDMIEDINLGLSGISFAIEYGRKAEAATLLVIFAAIQAADGKPFSQLTEIETKVASRLGTAPRLVHKALQAAKTAPAFTKFFGKEVTVYDRMGLNTFAID